jgi:hypothetical protein
VQKSLRKASNSQPHPSSVRAVAINLRDYQIQPRSQGLSFYHLGETLAAAGHVPPRFWEVNLIVTVRGVGKQPRTQALTFARPQAAERPWLGLVT